MLVLGRVTRDNKKQQTNKQQATINFQVLCCWFFLFCYPPGRARKWLPKHPWPVVLPGSSVGRLDVFGDSFWDGKNGWRCVVKRFL